MKKLVFLAVLLLFAVSLPCHEAEARLYPYGYRDTDSQTGDDHPWGGENHNNDDHPPSVTAESTRPLIVTGNTVLDLFLKRIIQPSLFHPVTFDGNTTFRSATMTTYRSFNHMSTATQVRSH